MQRVVLYGEAGSGTNVKQLKVAFACKTMTGCALSDFLRSIAP